jgi:pyoverdine/dityrosine biosynthesis protein Dit1
MTIEEVKNEIRIKEHQMSELRKSIDQIYNSEIKSEKLENHKNKMRKRRNELVWEVIRLKWALSSLTLHSQPE